MVTVRTVPMTKDQQESLRGWLRHSGAALFRKLLLSRVVRSQMECSRILLEKPNQDYEAEAIAASQDGVSALETLTYMQKVLDGEVDYSEARTEDPV